MRIVLLLLITLVGWATAQSSGQLRLVQNGITHPTFISGRLEVYHRGQWGTVCNDLWDSTNTRVACRQLGYFGFSVSWTTSSAGGFGSTTGRIWLDNVNCFGTESWLTSCSKNTFGVHNCYHFQDVAITCSCSSTQFRCTSGECIPDFTRCGGLRTCSDGSDEMNCISCGSGAFWCSNHQCINSSNHCDGTRDCTDGSDEIGCGSIVGTAVGASLASLVLLVIIPIIICIVIGCCVVSRRHRRTTVTTTTQPVSPATTTVVATSSREQSAQQGAYPAAGTDAKKAPPPSYEMSTYPPQPAYPSCPPHEVYPPPPQPAYPYPPQEVYPPPPQAAYPYPPPEVYPSPPQNAYPQQN